MLLFLGVKAALESLVQPQERSVERWMPALSAWPLSSSLRPQSGPTCWWQKALFLQVCRWNLLLQEQDGAVFGFKAALESLVQPQERSVERWMPALSALS